jgi:hypothetical protein
MAAIYDFDGFKVFDVCDDHFDRDHGEYYEFMIQNADLVTCNTAAMQERIYDVTGKLSQVVSDPISFTSGAVENLNFDDPKILWFGNAVNLESLQSHIGSLPNLTIITNVNIDIKPPNVSSMLWQEGLVENVIHDYDIVIIPRNDHEWALTKSPNRAVDAIHAGKFVISDFPEVYGELGDFMYIGDIQEGITFYNDPSNKDEVKNMIKAGKNYVKTKYNASEIVKRWINLFENRIESEED